MEQINNWTILSKTVKDWRTYCVCRCACGRVFKRRYDSLRKSKGCHVCANAKLKKHGEARTKLYFVWAQMKGRCLNPKNPEYKNYGARGIKVCDEWLDSSAFLSWAHSSGYADGLTIDRIDNDSGYTPDNCRWTNMHTQCMNKRYKPSNTGIRGVYFMGGNRKRPYDVQIGGKRVGLYSTIEEAVLARNKALCDAGETIYQEQ